jgi:hypothetical protein
MDQATYQAKVDVAFMNLYHSLKKNPFSRWLAVVKFYTVIMEHNPKLKGAELKTAAKREALDAARRQILKVAAQCVNEANLAPTVKVIEDLVALPA